MLSAPVSSGGNNFLDQGADKCRDMTRPNSQAATVQASAAITRALLHPKWPHGV